MEKLKKMINRKNFGIAVALFVLLQPIIDLDYLLYEKLNQLGLPRLSTIVRFVVLPLLILWAYMTQTKDKKKTAILAVSYGVVFAAYYVGHCLQAARLIDVMYFTTNFKFNWYQELVYLLTLVLPFGITYCVVVLKPSERRIKQAVAITSGLVAIPIFVSNLFVFGLSTYNGKAVANFLAWFTETEYHPRQLATKFYFAEGNTIGILMFIILPLMYYFFTKAKNKKEKIAWIVLIVIQSLSMQILGTRVATYGAVIVPVYFTVLYGVDVFMKNQKFSRICFITPLIIAIFFGLMLPYTPAVVNQNLNATNDVALIESNIPDEIANLKNENEALMPGTVEYNQFYIYMFEEYGIRAGYVHTVPQEYYIYWYNYKFDPIFWMDVIEMDVYDRVNGRQIQTIFMNYKLEKLQPTEHILGAGYSTFMNGSIILEQDFVQQWMTLGILGFSLTMLPWIVITAGLILVMVKKWKKHFNLTTFVYGAALVSGFGVGVVSGHTMDQFVTSTWLAVLLGILINRLFLTDSDGESNE